MRKNKSDLSIIARILRIHPAQATLRDSGKALEVCAFLTLVYTKL